MIAPILVLVIQAIVWGTIITAIRKAYKKSQQQAARKTPAQAETGSARLRQDDAERKASGKPSVAQIKAAAKVRKAAAEAARVPVQGGSGIVHSLEDSFSSGHSHEETSMTGFTECPPEKEHEEAKPAAAETPVAENTPLFAKEDLVKAVIWHEILSGPKAARR